MKQLKIGVFGLWRGLAYIKVALRMENVKIVSVCDMSEERIKKAAEKCGDDTKCFSNFDEFIVRSSFRAGSCLI